MRKMTLFLPSSSPIKVPEEEEEATMKQGIVTILRSDCERTKAASIWRTFSAHMSSKKWLDQYAGWFCNPIKKINASPEDSSSFSCDEKVPRQDDVWRSIQSHKEINYQMKKVEELDVWGSILTQKSPQNSSNVPPPYVHPATTLSEKSPEICTESLGSETGSNCFSSHPCSEISSDADEDHRQQEININPLEDLRVAKYRKSQVRPFPPPLPSISGGHGASIHMHSHRKNGRLVLEAVYVPPRKHFHAHRREGRLVLTLTSSPSSQENEVRTYW